MAPATDCNRDGERDRAEEILRSVFRDAIKERIERGLRVGVGDVFWSIRYADRVPPQVMEKHHEIRLIRHYYDEGWFKDLARQELERAARNLEDGKGRELIDLAR